MSDNVDKIEDKPFVLFVGPQRTGTTWIYEYLKSNGNVALPRFIKETGFFDENYSEGLEWYKHQFTISRETKSVVDVSTKYFSSKQAAINVQAIFPNAKIVIVYRKPISRAISLNRHLNRHRARKMTLLEDIKERGWICETSMYSKNTQMWVDKFGRENVFVVSYHELESDSQRYAERISKIIEIPFERNKVLDKRINASNFSDAYLERLVAKVVFTLRSFVGLQAIHYLKESFLGKFYSEFVLKRTQVGQSPIDAAADATDDYSRLEADQLQHIIGSDHLKFKSDWFHE